MEMSNNDKEKKDAKWIAAVERAKDIYKRAEKYQFKISKECLSVCEISWGGAVYRKNKDLNDEKYTLTRFAKECGINPKTLSNWCAVYYKVYRKLDESQKKRVKYSDVNEISRDVGFRAPQKKVQESYERLFSNGGQAAYSKYVKNMRSLATNLSRGGVYKIDDAYLKEVVFFCRKILAIIESEKPQALKQKIKYNYNNMKTYESAASAIVGGSKNSKRGAAVVVDVSND